MQNDQLFKRSNILENNQVQTIASAGALDGASRRWEPGVPVCPLPETPCQDGRLGRLQAIGQRDINMLLIR